MFAMPLKETKNLLAVLVVALAVACSPSSPPEPDSKNDDDLASTFKTPDALCLALSKSEISVTDLPLEDPVQNSFYLKCISEMFFGLGTDSERFEPARFNADRDRVITGKAENIKALLGAPFDLTYRGPDGYGLAYWLLMSEVPTEPVDSMLVELINSGIDVNMTFKVATGNTTPQYANQALQAARNRGRKGALGLLFAAGAEDVKQTFSDAQIEERDRSLCYSLANSKIKVTDLPLGDPADHAFYFTCTLINYLGEGTETEADYRKVREDKVENINTLMELPVNEAYVYKRETKNGPLTFEPITQAMYIDIPSELSEEVIIRFLEQGADPNHVTSFEKTYLQLADEWDLPRIREILIAYGATE